MLPVLPYLYVMMALGITFLFKITSLQRQEIKALLYRNVSLLLLICGGFLFASILIYHPEGKKEKVKGLRDWNILNIGKEYSSLVIFESQLAYPVKSTGRNGKSFRVLIGNREIPYLGEPGTADTRVRFYFTKTKDLLCKNGFFRIHKSHIVNLEFVETYFRADGGQVRLSEGTMLPVSDRKKASLLKIFSSI